MVREDANHERLVHRVDLFHQLWIAWTYLQILASQFLRVLVGQFASWRLWLQLGRNPAWALFPEVLRSQQDAMGQVYLDCWKENPNRRRVRQHRSKNFEQTHSQCFWAVRVVRTLKLCAVSWCFSVLFDKSDGRLQQLLLQVRYMGTPRPHLA